MADVGVAAAQTAAVEHVGAESGAVPEIGDARGAGRNLGVIRVDVVTLDVLELRQASEISERRGVIEQILVRHHRMTGLPPTQCRSTANRRRHLA